MNNNLKKLYTWSKGIVKWINQENILYLSVPFSWQLEKAKEIAQNWNGEVKIGGSGLMKPTECNNYEPIIFHLHQARRPQFKLCLIGEELPASFLKRFCLTFSNI